MQGKGALILAALLGGCGDSAPVANKAQPMLAAEVAAPINHSMEAPAKPAVQPAPSPAAKPKSLVSRETPARQTAAPDYRAIGTEPFWAVTVQGSVAILQRPDQKPVRFAVDRDDDERTIRFTGNGFSLKATEGPCSDGMSDAIWSDRVQIAFAQGTLKGCGGVREDMQDDRREDRP